MEVFSGVPTDGEGLDRLWKLFDRVLGENAVKWDIIDGILIFYGSPSKEHECVMISLSDSFRESLRSISRDLSYAVAACHHGVHYHQMPLGNPRDETSQPFCWKSGGRKISAPGTQLA